MSSSLLRHPHLRPLRRLTPQLPSPHGRLAPLHPRRTQNPPPNHDPLPRPPLRAPNLPLRLALCPRHSQLHLNLHRSNRLPQPHRRPHHRRIPLPLRSPPLVSPHPESRRNEFRNTLSHSAYHLRDRTRPPRLRVQDRQSSSSSVDGYSPLSPSTMLYDAIWLLCCFLLSPYWQLTRSNPRTYIL